MAKNRGRSLILLVGDLDVLINEMMGNRIFRCSDGLQTCWL